MTNEATRSIRLEVAPDQVDILVAELAEFGFDGFAEDGERLLAFVPENLWIGGARAATLATLARLGARIEDERTVQPENWNARWEASIEPVNAGPFCVHPPWREALPGSIPIVIEPKMSFGTGHHETTRLMLSFVARLVRPGCSVLDAGTGTGVLAIAAVRCGARMVNAFDVDRWSVENTLENVAANGVSERVQVGLGGLEVAPEGPFDVILANINRNVLLDMLPGFRSRLGLGGHLALAGVLTSDRDVMLTALADNGFVRVGEEREGDWLALVAARD